MIELGYLAAPMAFSGDTEEVVLTVNGIKKVRPFSSPRHLIAITDPIYRTFYHHISLYLHFP